jgi:hypothetical protein
MRLIEPALERSELPRHVAHLRQYSCGCVMLFIAISEAEAELFIDCRRMTTEIDLEALLSEIIVAAQRRGRCRGLHLQVVAIHALET